VIEVGGIERSRYDRIEGQTWEAWIMVRSFILENPASIRPLSP